VLAVWGAKLMKHFVEKESWQYEKIANILWRIVEHLDCDLDESFTDLDKISRFNWWALAEAKYAKKRGWA
jgi:hypothetical protein